MEATFMVYPKYMKHIKYVYKVYDSTGDIPVGFGESKKVGDYLEIYGMTQNAEYENKKTVIVGSSEEYEVHN